MSDLIIPWGLIWGAELIDHVDKVFRYTSRDNCDLKVIRGVEDVADTSFREYGGIVYQIPVKMVFGNAYRTGIPMTLGKLLNPVSTNMTVDDMDGILAVVAGDPLGLKRIADHLQRHLETYQTPAFVELVPIEDSRVMIDDCGKQSPACIRVFSNRDSSRSDIIRIKVDVVTACPEE